MDDKNIEQISYGDKIKVKEFVPLLLRAANLMTPEQRIELKFCSLSKILVNGKNYLLMDGKNIKVVLGEDYNFVFDKKNGNFKRWGKNYEDDPEFSPIGGEILDCEITTICKGINGKLCSYCSPGGTKINTPNGTKNIEKIRAGDFILGFDIKNDHIMVQKVEEIYKRHYSGKIICIETEDKEVLRLTPEHIVLLKGGIEKQAKNLNKNDEIISF